MKLPPDKKSGCEVHTSLNIHAEMYLQIHAEYHNLPPDLDADGIAFFYNGIRGALKKYTAPKQK